MDWERACFTMDEVSTPPKRGGGGGGGGGGVGRGAHGPPPTPDFSFL